MLFRVREANGLWKLTCRDNARARREWAEARAPMSARIEKISAR
jgi:hypothetical protein